jgi:uncharacterized glyoxalase superfamily protein PhnB
MNTLHTIAMKNRSVPADIVLPHVVYRSVSQASEWLARVFGFTEHYRYGDPVSGIQMYLGNAFIMITGPREGTDSPLALGGSTQSLTIFVADVDAHCAKAKQEGAITFEEPHETVYGEWQYGAIDLDGHRWLFSRHARDLSPADWGATIASPPS